MDQSSSGRFSLSIGHCGRGDPLSPGHVCFIIIRTMKKSVIVGTAGHIDHGKSALVMALTGTDPDRWAEEKRRGITIDLGFAHLDLGDEVRVGFVDVPGHERFVRNMLAGASGIDMVLLVVAADESIKPQTREHFDICRLLKVKRGLVVLTKSDLVEPDLLELVQMEMQEYLKGSFLEGAPILATSARTGEGLDALKDTLREMAGKAESRNTARPLRLPIDRAFVMKGFGTVVTGTLASGKVEKDQEVEILPVGRKVRVRGIQVHSEDVGLAHAGQRTALNLVGIEKAELARGMVLATSDTLRPTRRMDCSLTLLDSARPLKANSRVHLHLGTAETIAEVVLLRGGPIRPGESDFVQLRLAEPAVAVLGDRFIIRQFSPLVTLGGGAVLDNHAPRHKRNEPSLADFLGALAKGSTAECLSAFSRHRGVTTGKDLRARTGWSEEEIEASLGSLEAAGDLWRISNRPLLFLHQEPRKALTERVLDYLKRFHQEKPLLAGVPKQELRSKTFSAAEGKSSGPAQTMVDESIFEALLTRLGKENKIAAQGETVRLESHKIILTQDEAQAKQTISHAFNEAGLAVPSMKDVLAKVGLERKRAVSIVQILIKEKSLVKITEDLMFHQNALEGLRRRLADFKKKKETISVREFKDLAGVSRKYAIPLLEYLDRERVTRRQGDERLIL